MASGMPLEGHQVCATNNTAWSTYMFFPPCIRGSERNPSSHLIIFSGNWVPIWFQYVCVGPFKRLISYIWQAWILADLGYSLGWVLSYNLKEERHWTRNMWLFSACSQFTVLNNGNTYIIPSQCFLLKYLSFSTAGENMEQQANLP